jgi:Flp pilus assembly secretin CpaC
MTRMRTALLATAAALLSGAALAEDGEAPPQMSVAYDHSALLHLDRPAKTVIVGNPSIADAQLVNDHTIYVLGRMFGNTNVIAVDSEGAEVTNTMVTVGAPQIAQVTVYRGPAGQRNLACAPQCERTITQGDSEMQAMYQDGDKKVEISQKSAVLSAEK